MKSDLIVAVHGILTRQTCASWPDRLCAWMIHRDVPVLKKEYSAGPFPRLNYFIRNPRLADGLVEELLLFHEDTRIHFVGHSNGGDICRRVVERLERRGREVATLILIGSVTDAELSRNGIPGMIGRGHLGQAVCFWNESDAALKIHCKWPYRSLGRTGWLLGGHRPSNLPVGISERHFANYGHSGYFDDSRRERTFETIAQICGV